MDPAIETSLGAARQAIRDGRLLDGLAALRQPLSAGEVDDTLNCAAEAFTCNRPLPALGLLRWLVARARAQRLPEVEASASGMLAQGLVLAGRRREAREYAERALGIAQQLGDVAAAEHFEGLVESLASGAPAGLANRVVAGSQLHAQVEAACTAAGRALERELHDEAIALLTSAVAAASAGGVPEAEASARGVLAQAFLLAGRRDEALVHLERALEIATTVGDAEAEEGFRSLLDVLAGLGAGLGTG